MQAPAGAPPGRACGSGATSRSHTCLTPNRLHTPASRPKPHWAHTFTRHSSSECRLGQRRARLRPRVADVRKTTPATGQLEAAELRRTLDPGHAKGACGFYTMSDVHTDHPENMQWIRDLAEGGLYRDHVLLLPGDISDDIDMVRETLAVLRRGFREVCFTPGNHDLWVRGSGPDAHRRNGGCSDSLAKLRLVMRVCEEEGVRTSPFRLGPVVVAPLFSWHHKSWDKERDIAGFSPVGIACNDYRACQWPASVAGGDEKGSLALAEWFDALNDDPSALVMSDAAQSTSGERTTFRQRGSNSRRAQEAGGGAVREFATAEEAACHARLHGCALVTMSHYLPYQLLLPEKRYLTYPDFAKMSGSDPLGSRVNRLRPHIHIYGHTHFAWDTALRWGDDGGDRLQRDKEGRGGGGGGVVGRNGERSGGGGGGESGLRYERDVSREGQRPAPMAQGWAKAEEEVEGAGVAGSMQEQGVGGGGGVRWEGRTRFVQAPLSTPREREKRPGSLLLMPRWECSSPDDPSVAVGELEARLRASGAHAPWLPVCVAVGHSEQSSGMGSGEGLEGSMGGGGCAREGVAEGMSESMGEGVSAPITGATTTTTTTPTTHRPWEMPAPLMAHWSAYYERNDRRPDDITLAPWVSPRRARKERGMWDGGSGGEGSGSGSGSDGEGGEGA